MLGAETPDMCLWSRGFESSAVSFVHAEALALGFGVKGLGFSGFGFRAWGLGFMTPTACEAFGINPQSSPGLRTRRPPLNTSTSKRREQSKPLSPESPVILNPKP